ncbi:MAG TPA: gliding motility-associated C-terminal domain-containing protein, partial [Brumimicrobium sp.]|nr:gliding motility-associated C-terminal domain-containing protein [Brumimicrobium sp.]
LAGGATWNFNFTVLADLSACNTDFTIVTWVEYGLDVNNNNDTLTFTVRNDCTVIPGKVDNSELVCEGTNTNTLNLNGWQHGTITNWLFSEDAGVSWNSIANTTTSHVFNNLTDETQFAVEIDGGYCPNDTSDVAIITIQPLPFGGNLSGPTALCISSADGTINLSGNSNSVLNWESSVDNGVSWANIANTTTSESFVGLTETTLYRVLVDGDLCSNVYSDTLEVYIEEVSVAGLLKMDTLICENESVDLALGTSVGDVNEWESSIDGVVWNPIATSPIGTYNTGALSTSTYYRVSVVNGICPSDISNEVYVQVQPNVVAGTIGGGTSTCASNATGVLEITGNTGGVIEWESSVDEGVSWSTIANTTTTENYLNLSETVWYRALIDGGVCMDRYTDTAYIIVSPNSVSGVLAVDTALCEGEPYTLTLSGNVGPVTSWEYSTGQNNWVTINTTDSSYTVSSALNSTSYRVIVKNGICDEDTTNTVFVDVYPSPVADAGVDVSILEGDSIMLNGSGGVVGAWSADPSLSDITVYNPIASPIVTTTYYLTVISEDGCFDSDQVVVNVGPPIPNLDIKNVITANNDGFNDTWIIEGIEGYPSMSVRVYNIYGKLVLEDDDYKNDWRGDYNSKMLPNGTYLYVVMPGGTEDIFKGNLTILGDE